MRDKIGYNKNEQDEDDEKVRHKSYQDPKS